MRHSSIPRQNQHRPRGFVLVTSLIFLVVLSTLTIMALQRSFFEEKMSSNDRDNGIAREMAELALRDAERDIDGMRIDGIRCAAAPPGPGVAIATCGGNRRPAGNRPANGGDAATFWSASNIQFPSIGLTTVSNAARPAPVSNTENGVYTQAATIACGRQLWQAADWDADPPTQRCTGGTAFARTTIYGEFTGAPNPFGGAACTTASVPRCPRYLIEILTSDNMGITVSSNKIFFRITAVGFGRLASDATVRGGGASSVTLQSVYSPL